MAAPIEYNYIEYNYKGKAALERYVPYIRSGADAHGLSVFLRDGDRGFHTYSTCGRGVDQLIGTYQYLDLARWGGSGTWPGSRITTSTRVPRDRGLYQPDAPHHGLRRSRARLTAGSQAAQQGAFCERTPRANRGDRKQVRARPAVVWCP